jgi:hypothetical protein
MEGRTLLGALIRAAACERKVFQTTGRAGAGLIGHFLRKGLICLNLSFDDMRTKGAIRHPMALSSMIICLILI